jgi:hypothetical protein
MTDGAAAQRFPIGRVVTLGAFILDVLGRPVQSIPPGQGSVVLQEIRATAAGTAAGPAVDLAKLGAQVWAIGALGDDVIADIIVAILERHGVDTAGLARRPGVQTAATMLPIRPNGERPALHVPGAMTQLWPADIDLGVVRDRGHQGWQYQNLNITMRVHNPPWPGPIPPLPGRLVPPPRPGRPQPALRPQNQARLGFPTAVPRLATRTAAAEIAICGPLAA